MAPATIGLLAILALPWAARAQDGGLADALEELNLPPWRMPAVAREERLYAVQSRHNDLAGRHEATVGGSVQMFGGGHLSSRRLHAGYLRHLDARWALRANAAKVFNSLNSSGRLLLARRGLVPDKDYGRTALDIQASYNAIYGKFRLTMDRTFYFDGYGALGAGVIDLRSGAAPMLTGEAGLVLWLGRATGLRLGIRDEFHRERTGRGRRARHNVMAVLSAGRLFGQDRG